MKGTRLVPVAVMIGVFALVAALSRIPGMLPQNFSAIYALAFCSGVYLRGHVGWWLPLGVLLGTDICLNLLYYHEPFLNGYMLVKTMAFAGLILFGRLFRPGTTWWKLIGGGLVGAVLFYLVTNTAAWLHDPGYPKTLAGLWQALTTGLPGYPPTWAFFRNTLVSGGLFTALFTGSAKLVASAESKREQEQPEEEEEATPEEAPDGAQA